MGIESRGGLRFSSGKIFTLCRIFRLCDVTAPLAPEIFATRRQPRGGGGTWDTAVVDPTVIMIPAPWTLACTKSSLAERNNLFEEGAICNPS